MLLSLHGFLKFEAATHSYVFDGNGNEDTHTHDKTA